MPSSDGERETILRVQADARWDEAPLQRPPAADFGDAAWHTIGDILFWLHKDASRHRDAIASLWQRLDGQILLAAGDVLHQLASSQWRSLPDNRQGVDLIALFPQEARRIAEACLNQAADLPSVFDPTASSTNN